MSRMLVLMFLSGQGCKAKASDGESRLVAVKRGRCGVWDFSERKVGESFVINKVREK